jgi:hypothetical protein
MPGWHFWLVGFGLTLALEAPVVLTLLSAGEPRWLRRVSLFVFANLVTHPLVWFFFPLLPWARPASLTLSELWAFGAEAVFFASLGERVSPWRAAATSLLANGTSFSLGWLLTRYFGQWLFRV